MFLKFWNDESGAIISAELVTVMTVAVIAMVAGLSALRDSVTGELADVGQSLSNLDQSYAIGGIRSPSASIAGMTFVDERDFADTNSVSGSNNRGLVVHTPQLPITRDNSYMQPDSAFPQPSNSSGWID